MKGIFIIVILVSIAAVPLLLGYWTYKIDINTLKFREKYLEFIMELGAAGVSFGLFTIFWASQQKNAQRRRARKIVARFLRQIQDLTTQCEDWLSRAYSESEVRESQERDDRVLQLLRSIGVAKEGLLLHYPYEEMEEDKALTAVAIDLFMNRMVPIINEFSTRTRVRGETKVILGQLQEIDTTAQQSLDLLLGRRVWRSSKSTGT